MVTPSKPSRKAGSTPEPEGGSRAAGSEGEERLALALEAGQLGFWDWDIPSGRAYFGGSWAEMLGYENAEIEPHVRTWEALLHPEDRGRVMDVLTAHLEGRSPYYECELRMRHKDGSWRWIRTRGSVVERDAEGRPIRAVGTHTDITDQRLVQDELRDSEERFRALVETWAQVVWETNAEGTAMVDFSSWSAFTGLSQEECLGDGWLNAVHPDDREYLARTWWSGMQQGSPINAEYRLRSPDGTWRWTNVRGVPLRDASGVIRKWVGMNIDITKRKRAEEALRESEERFRLMSDGLPLIVWVHDAQGRLQFVNRAFGEFFAVPPEEMRGDRWKVLAHPEDGPAYAAEFAACVREQRPFHAQLRARRWDGAWRWMESFGQPRFSASGEFLGIVGVSVDVTERNEAEAALREAGRRKDEFLAMLAHELRNPLTPILNAAALLETAAAADPTVARQRSIIQRQAEHMARLVSDLLDVSRLTRGKLSLHRSPLDLGEVVRACAEDYRTVVERAGLELRLDLPPEPVTVEGDPIRLCQAVGNLLSNAVKFTAAHGLVTVRVERVPASDTAVLTVTDTGAGISAGILPSIWDTFVQGEQDTARTSGGLGLGLALVKAVVEMHGGSVAAASGGPGKGAAFTLTLPLYRDTVVPSLPRPPDEETSGEPLRVLIIEDNRDAAETLQDLLELHGCQVRIATNGPAGLETAHDWLPHVVVCDIGLPGMDGYEVARRWRALPHGAETRLVALTGYGSQEDIQRARAAGFDSHLTKPVPVESVMAALKAAR